MLKTILLNTFVIIGTMIGAGFASGQEIYTFFNKYGNKGLIGISLSIILIGLITHKTLAIIKKKNIDSYEKFITYIIPTKLKNNKILIFSITNIVNVFLLMSFYIMAAGFGTYFLQELNIAKMIGTTIIAAFTFITLLKGIEGITKVNGYLIPILIIMILFLGGIKIDKSQILYKNENIKNFSWILSSIVYASYNSITLIPILIKLGKHIKLKKEIKGISIFTVIIILILSITIFLLMNTYFDQIKNIEIPIIYIASTLGKEIKHIYGLLILIAIFTTAISAGYGFLSNVAVNRRKYGIISLIICVTSIFTSKLSFSSLISQIYPIFGYLGIMQIIFILLA